MDIYREIILDHYKHPRNFGHLKKFNTSATGENVTCGDSIIIEVSFNKNHKPLTVCDIAFLGQGCVISQASASILTEYVEEKTSAEIMNLNTSHVLDLLGTTLTPSRVKCAMLPLEVLQKAIFKKK